jgi:hypothetical protein
MKNTLLITAIIASIYCENLYSQKYFKPINILNEWEQLQYITDINSYDNYSITDDIILKFKITSITKISSKEKVLVEGKEEYSDRWIYDTLGNFIKRETWFMNYHLSKDTLEQKIPPEPLKVSYIKYNNEGYYIGDSTVVFGHMRFWEQECVNFGSDSLNIYFSKSKLKEKERFYNRQYQCKLNYVYNEKGLISKVEYYDYNNEFLYAYFYRYEYY